jgi:hypothetical protein
VENFSIVGRGASFGTRCSVSITRGRVSLSFHHFCEGVDTFGICFGGFLVRVANGIGNNEIILWSSVSWSAAVDPSFSPFLHMSALDARLASSIHSGGVSRFSLLRQIQGLVPLARLEGGSWLHLGRRFRWMKFKRRQREHSGVLGDACNF